MIEPCNVAWSKKSAAIRSESEKTVPNFIREKESPTSHERGSRANGGIIHILSARKKAKIQAKLQQRGARGEARTRGRRMLHVVL